MSFRLEELMKSHYKFHNVHIFINVLVRQNMCSSGLTGFTWLVMSGCHQLLRKPRSNREYIQ